MNEQDIDQNYDEILMFIYDGKPGAGRNIFMNTIRKAVNNKLDEVIEILEKNVDATLIDDICELKNY